VNTETTPDAGFAPGDRLYAWCAYGLDAAGDNAHARGMCSAADEAAARALVGTRLPDLPGGPKLRVTMHVWDLPLWAAAGALAANGYRVTPPPG
jgi:hypothetical protein